MSFPCLKMMFVLIFMIFFFVSTRDHCTKKKFVWPTVWPKLQKKLSIRMSGFYFVGAYFVAVVKTSNWNVDLNNLKSSFVNDGNGLKRWEKMWNLKAKPLVHSTFFSDTYLFCRPRPLIVSPFFLFTSFSSWLCCVIFFFSTCLFLFSVSFSEVLPAARLWSRICFCHPHRLLGFYMQINY